MSLQISYVSWSFIISLVGCFTGTRFSHRADIENDMTVYPPPAPKQQESFNFRLKAVTTTTKRFQGKMFQRRNGIDSNALENISYSVASKNTRVCQVLTGNDLSRSDTVWSSLTFLWLLTESSKILGILLHRPAKHQQPWCLCAESH